MANNSSVKVTSAFTVTNLHPEQQNANQLQQLDVRQKLQHSHAQAKVSSQTQVTAKSTTIATSIQLPMPLKHKHSNAPTDMFSTQAHLTTTTVD